MSGCYKGCYYYTDSCFRVDCVKGNNRNDNKMYYRIEEVETSTTMGQAELYSVALEIAMRAAESAGGPVYIIQVSDQGEEIVADVW